MDDFVTNASSKSNKRLISAHFLRVAAEFTGREKYKTALARAWVFATRRKERQGSGVRHRAGRSTHSNRGTWGYRACSRKLRAHFGKSDAKCDNSAGSYRRRTSGGFSLFPGARKLSCARRDHVQGFKAAKRSQNEPLFQIRADASHIFAFSRLHLNPARIQPWVVYDSQ
jgi:hypothetical protein